MTVLISKPAFNLREALNSLKRKIGLKGAEIMAAETVDDVYNIIGTNRNKIINGAMVIDQRNAGAAVTINNVGIYSIDRWSCVARPTGGGVYSAQQVSDAPTGFSNSLKFTVTTTDTSLGTSDYYFAWQKIEGFNTADLMFGTANAKTVTLSFWVKSSITGQFSAFLTNQSESYSHPSAYTVNAANTWEFKTLTFTGATAGTWIGATNGVGLIVGFGLATGTSLQSASGAWAASYYYGSTGDVNWMATNGNTWQVTGVQLEVGTQATPFERRPYGTELALCQRYFESSFPAGTVAPLKGSSTTSLGSGGQPAQQTDWLATFTSGTINGYQKFLVPKRASPTMTVWGTSADKCIFYDFGTKAIIYPGFIIATSNPAGFQGYNDGAGLTNNSSWGFDLYNWSASAEL